MTTTLVIFLLSVGTLALWAGRAYVQFYAGVPPTPWLAMEMVFAAGPAFGWWCHSSEGQVLWIAMLWAICGIVSMIVSRFILNRYQEEKQKAIANKACDLNGREETNPMIRALNRYESVDRTFDFGPVDSGERLARSRRNKISAVS